MAARDASFTCCEIENTKAMGVKILFLHSYVLQCMSFSLAGVAIFHRCLRTRLSDALFFRCHNNKNGENNMECNDWFVEQFR